MSVLYVRDKEGEFKAVSVGPKGDKGDTGVQGPKGDKGDKGEPGIGYALTEDDKQEIAGIAAELIEVPDSSGGGGAQADWNAADGEPGHILNRPFYKKAASNELILDNHHAIYANDMFCIDQPMTLKAGIEYTVTWNGEVFVCTSSPYNGDCVALGNLSAIGGSNTGEPFIILTVPPEEAASEGYYGAAFAYNGDTSLYLSIAATGCEVVKIPEEFIPEDAMKSRHVVNFEIRTDEKQLYPVWMSFDEILAMANAGYNVVARIPYVNGTLDLTLARADSTHIEFTGVGTTATTLFNLEFRYNKEYAELTVYTVHKSDDDINKLIDQKLSDFKPGEDFTAPNPHPLVFKGAASVTYNGSEEVTVYIPQLTPEFANSIEECTDTTKVYVLPDGYIYAYVKGVSGIPDIEIEGQTGGYWYADEWNPTGKWQASSSASGKRTNVIPVTPGDTFSYKGGGNKNVCSVAWLDASQKYLSQEYYSATGSTVTLTAPENAAYAWFGSFDYTASHDNVVLVVEITNYQGAIESYAWRNTGHAFMSSGQVDVLSGKKIVYDGDSICLGYNANGGYPAKIASIVNGEYVNQSVGGARLCAHTERHSVVNNLENLPTDGDLYCFQGGINDFWGNTAIGECTPGDYTGTLDTSTICGAMETIFRHALTHFLGKPICFIITHKIQDTAYSTNANGNTFKDYRDAMVGVCEKYSIPYYDAFSESGLNGWNEAQKNAYTTSGSGPDGIHPNEDGYKRYYVPQLLDLFRRIMPVS